MKKLLILPLIFIILALLTVSPIFKISQIQLDGASCTSDNIADYFKDKNIFLLSSNITLEIKDKNPCITEILIQKNYPNKLTISVKSKSIIAKIEGTDFYFSEDGLVSANSEGKNLPTVLLPSEVTPTLQAKIENKEVLFSLQLLKMLEKSDFNPTNVRFLGFGDIAIYGADEAVAVVSAGKDAEKQVDSLQQVLSKARIDATKIAKIDLRFDKPVVTIN